jgi:hypothetical protein
MRFARVENGKFQIAVEGCCYNGLPRHEKMIRANLPMALDPHQFGEAMVAFRRSGA